MPLMVSRGFSSESYLYEAAEAIKDSGKPAFLNYFGDHDPSGVKIDPAIRRGLERLAPDADITVHRVAVTTDQIDVLSLPTRPTNDVLSLPTRPTKRGRNSHAKEFDGDSVELDAIPPDILRQMVRACIEQHINQRSLEITRIAERNERDLFRRLKPSLAEGGESPS